MIVPENPKGCQSEYPRPGANMNKYEEAITVGEEKKEEVKCSRFGDLRCKEVICVTTCVRLGFICDLDINDRDGRVMAIVLPGGGGCFGFFRREEDIVIPWSKIKKIGEDIILVEFEREGPPKKRERRWF